jgi:hypothetical protein
VIFADFEYDEHYSDIHHGLVEFVREHFDDVQHGLQGDSWIWIFDGDDKVEIDTFSSMTHQVKSASPHSRLLDNVLERLTTRYTLNLYDTPEPEPHED